MQNSNFRQLARQIARRITKPKTVIRPPNTEHAMHVLTVTGTNIFNATVDVEFPHPTDPTTVTGVRYVLPYSSTNPPANGHTVVAQQYGTDLWVVGQLLVPVNGIIPT